MVFFYTSNVVSPSYTIYMGIDKHENEELIRWGWPEDVWFHVDKLSSAHVYLRLHEGDTLDDVPQAVIEDCAQLVKANSIQGCKQNNVDIVYTMWSNLKKTGDMAVGQVGFHKGKEVRKIQIEKKNNEIVKRLEKTKIENPEPDLRGMKEERDRKERAKLKENDREKRKQEREDQARKEEEAKLKSYSSLFSGDKMRSNADGYDSDEFM